MRNSLTSCCSGLPAARPAADRQSVRPTVNMASEAGFVQNELLMATGVLVLLVGIGFGVSWLLGLTGPAAVLPVGMLVGGAVLLVVAINIADVVRRRGSR